MNKKYFKLAALISMFIAFYSPANAWQVEQSSFSSWLVKIQIFELNLDPLQQFFTQRSNSDIRKYSDVILENYKNRLHKFKTSLDNLDCKNSVNIKFDQNLTQSQAADVRNFESQLLQMEAVACLPSLNLEKAVETFYSDRFQLAQVEGLRQSSSDESRNIACQSTSVFGVGKSNYCLKYSFWRDEKSIIVFSSNTQSDLLNTAPVYLRLVTTVFQKLPDGRIMIYNLTYGRGPQLPFHSFVKSVAAKQQVNLMQALVSTVQ